MRLSIGGSALFDANEVWFQPYQRLRVGQTGGYTVNDIHWTIYDFIQGESQADLSSKITAREAAIKNITGDVVFTDNSDSPTPHKITYANTINGIKAQVIQYPGGMPGPGGFGSGAEYAQTPGAGAGNTFRWLVTTIAAQEVIGEIEIAFYSQSHMYNLGGTQFAVQGAFTGLPSRFNTMLSTPGWAIQRGRVVGMTGYPTPPTPLVGALALDPDRSWIQTESPQLIGTVSQRLFPLTFNYFFRATTPMPSVPPATP